MSDNERQPHSPVQLGVLGFANKPGEAALVGDGSSVVCQRWFSLAAGQIHPDCPATTTACNLWPATNSASGSASGSNLDSDPDRQTNIRFVTLALRAGSRFAYHTEQLDAPISNGDMDQLSIKIVDTYFAALVSINIDAYMKQQSQQPLGSS